MTDAFDMKAFLEFVEAHHPMINGYGAGPDRAFVLLRAVGTPDQYRLPVSEWNRAVETDLDAQLGGPGMNSWEVGDTGHIRLQELRAAAKPEGGAA